MSVTTIMIIIAGVLVLAWIALAYAIGRYFGIQEQMLTDLKREHEQYKKDVIRKQNEMEEDWQAYYAEQEAIIAQSEGTLQAPENVKQIKEATFTRN